MNWTAIDAGSLIKKEINRKTQAGMKIKDEFANYEFCQDDVVIDIVRKAIADCEKDNKSFVITGFPRTQKQALSLQSMGIVPDKIIVMHDQKKPLTLQSKKNLQEAGVELAGEKLEKKV